MRSYNYVCYATESVPSITIPGVVPEGKRLFRSQLTRPLMKVAYGFVIMPSITKPEKY